MTLVIQRAEHRDTQAYHRYVPRVRASKRDLSAASSATPRTKLLLVKPKTIACKGAIASISAASSTEGGSASAHGVAGNSWVHLAARLVAAKRDASGMNR